MTDAINPSHYKSGNGIEVIDVVEGFDLSPGRSKAVEYIIRAGRKAEDPVPCLRKALAYIEREIARIEHERETGEKYLPLGRGFLPAYRRQEVVQRWMEVPVLREALHWGLGRESWAAASKK